MRTTTDLTDRHELTPATAPQAPAARPRGYFERKIAALADDLPPGVAFEFQPLDGPPQLIGAGAPAFCLRVRNGRGAAALRSMDELRIGEAYLGGDLDLDGDLVAALHLRDGLTDRHPWLRLWAVYAQRLIFGQAARDKKWVSEHYDHEADFYLLFLDKQTRCYSHGYFERDDETLEEATQRKLNTAIRECGMQPGWRVLDIGAGWGAFTQQAGRRGIRVTSLTISAASEAYVRGLIEREALPCRVLFEHFLEHRSAEPYDAIVNLGVSEHLPDYPATLAQYRRLLKPGGRVFLDMCATPAKHTLSAFVKTHIWPGNTTPVALGDYVQALAATPFELLYVRNDRHSYLLTARHWAERLDRSRDEIVRRWGERLYRRFRMFLWGCVYSFGTRDVTAYRLLLQKPHEGESG